MAFGGVNLSQMNSRMSMLAETAQVPCFWMLATTGEFCCVEALWRNCHIKVGLVLTSPQFIHFAMQDET